MIWEIVFGSFGVAGAVVLVGGWILLRFYRDRQQFHLMQTALEKGITALPGGVPGWVISLRQGVLAFVLGAGVAVSGVVLAVSAAHIEEIPASVTAHFEQVVAAHGMDIHGQNDGPPQSPHGEGGPEDRGGPGRGDHPLPDPTLERWHRVQTQQLIGLLAMCAGGIVALLGVVRMSFARIERRYALEFSSVASRGTEA
jgi:hypothetical protein